MFLFYIHDKLISLKANPLFTYSLSIAAFFISHSFNLTILQGKRKSTILKGNFDSVYLEDKINIQQTFFNLFSPGATRRRH